MRRGLLFRASLSVCALALVAGPQIAPVAASTGVAPSSATSKVIGIRGDAAGFSLDGEKILDSGAAIVTYNNGGQKIKALARPGSTISVEPLVDGQIVSAGVDTSSGKANSKDGKPHAYRSKESAAKDLVEFGMSAAQIKQHFPDLSGGAAPTAMTGTAGDSWSAPKYATRASGASLDVPALNSWVYYNPPEFFDLQCVNFDNTTTQIYTRYTMSGCTEIYSAQRNGLDWYFVVRYTAWVLPYGEFLMNGFGFKNQWDTYVSKGLGNQTYGATPSGPINIASGSPCPSTTLAINAGFATWSVTSDNICGGTMSPWYLSRYAGGAYWIGPAVYDNSVRGVAGGFGLRNPPGVALNYGSYYIVHY